MLSSGKGKNLIYFVDCFAVLKELSEKLIKLYKECVYYEYTRDELFLEVFDDPSNN